jgi:hypothetical protein
MMGLPRPFYFSKFTIQPIKEGFFFYLFFAKLPQMGGNSFKEPINYSFSGYYQPRPIQLTYLNSGFSFEGFTFNFTMSLLNRLDSITPGEGSLLRFIWITSFSFSF